MQLYKAVHSSVHEQGDTRASAPASAAGPFPVQLVIASSVLRVDLVALSIESMRPALRQCRWLLSLLIESILSCAWPALVLQYCWLWAQGLKAFQWEWSSWQVQKRGNPADNKAQ